MLNPLQSAIETLEAARLELENIDRREREANDNLTKAAEHGSIESPKTQRAIGDARMILDLCAGRRRVLKRELPALQETVLERLNDAETACVRAVNQWLDQKATIYAGAVAGVCGGNVPAIGRHSRELNDIPGVEAARKWLDTGLYIIALTDARRGDPPGARVAQIARSFCAAAKRCFKAIGLDLPE